MFSSVLFFPALFLGVLLILYLCPVSGSGNKFEPLPVIKPRYNIPQVEPISVAGTQQSIEYTEPAPTPTPLPSSPQLISRTLTALPVIPSAQPATNDPIEALEQMFAGLSLANKPRDTKPLKSCLRKKPSGSNPPLLKKVNFQSTADGRIASRLYIVEVEKLGTFRDWHTHNRQLKHTPNLKCLPIVQKDDAGNMYYVRPEGVYLEPKSIGNADIHGWCRVCHHKHDRASFTLRFEKTKIESFY